MENNYCVYIHRNKTNNKVYVGITNNTKNRWRANGKGYKNYETDTPRPFYNAIQKYGWENFEHIILEDNLTFEKACELEQEYIKEYKATFKKYGYNVAEGGNGGRIYKVHPRGMKGKKHTKEKKKQQSILMARLNAEGKTGAVWKNGHPKGMKGKKHSEEVKQQISETCKANNINCKEVCVEFPNGEKLHFKSATETANQLNISIYSVYRMIKKGTPYQLNKNVTCNIENFKKIEGCVFKYITENTEVN